MEERCVVRDDGTAYATDDTIDDEIIDMYGSGMFSIVLRVVDGKIEYAEVYDNVDGVVWEHPKHEQV